MSLPASLYGSILSWAGVHRFPTRVPLQIWGTDGSESRSPGMIIVHEKHPRHVVHDPFTDRSSLYLTALSFCSNNVHLNVRRIVSMSQVYIYVAAKTALD